MNKGFEFDREHHPVSRPRDASDRNNEPLGCWQEGLYRRGQHGVPHSLTSTGVTSVADSRTPSYVSTPAREQRHYKR